MTAAALDALAAAQVRAIRTTGQTVTISDGTNTVDLKASFGRSTTEIDEGQRVARVERSDRDFLVVAADLVLNGAQVTPDRGWTVLWTSGGSTFTYEVRPLGKEKHWRYSGPSNAVLRIHTKLVDAT